jgi:hypothetical protein
MWRLQDPGIVRGTVRFVGVVEFGASQAGASRGRHGERPLQADRARSVSRAHQAEATSMRNNTLGDDPRDRRLLPERRSRSSTTSGAEQGKPGERSFTRELLSLATGVLVVLLAALLIGCAAVPDPRPLADASAQLRAAVAASGASAAAQLDGAGQAERAAALRSAWQVPERSTAAIARYAEALTAIARAGGAGGDSVRRVADAGAELAGAVGLVLPASLVIPGAIDAAAQVYQQIAVVRATRAMDEAVSTMQPAIERIVTLITAQVDAAQAIAVNANRIGEVKLRAQYSEETGYLLALRKERVALYAVTPLSAANAERLLQIERVERGVLARLAPMNSELRTANAQLAAMVQVAEATRQALVDWAFAHRQLGQALRDGVALDPQALLQSIEQLRELGRSMRAR